MMVMMSTVEQTILYIQIFLTVFISLECKSNLQLERWEWQLGSKTPYRAIANIDDTVLEFPGCVPRKIWMVARHGTRYPSKSLIEKIKRRLSEIRTLILNNNLEPSQRLRESDLDALKNWEMNLVDDDHKLLTIEGEEEMLELAERMQGRFPTLFPTIYSNTSYFFKYTATQRTIISAKYFVIGLFGKPAVKAVWYPRPLVSDPILRFYKLCTRWQKKVKNNPAALKEYKLFENGPHMFNAIESINEELNLDNELSIDDVYLMYMTCSFETAWSKTRRSPWCSTIPPDTLKAMEFGEDLKYYYKHAYGFEINFKQACPLFKNLVDYFEDGSMYPHTTVYFTHSGTLLKFLAHLQLYKDAEPLTHNKFEGFDRRWRLGKIGGFSSNIAFVLYVCGSTKKVAVLHQERLIQLPNCDNFLCDFTKIKKYYSNSINNCVFEKICDLP